MHTTTTYTLKENQFEIEMVRKDRDALGSMGEKDTHSAPVSAKHTDTHSHLHMRTILTDFQANPTRKI